MNELHILYGQKVTTHELFSYQYRVSSATPRAVPPIEFLRAPLSSFGNSRHSSARRRTYSLLGHHTVRVFLSSYIEESREAKFLIEDDGAEQSLAETCITYLSFVDFHKAVIPTIDTRCAQNLNQPVNLLREIFPSVPRVSAALLGRSNRLERSGKSFNPVDILRSEMSLHQSKQSNLSFQLLEYCKTYWHDHSRWLIWQDRENSEVLKKFICRGYLLSDWKPWNKVSDDKYLIHWNMFFWAVREGHCAIFRIWQSIVETEEIVYWRQLWLKVGPALFTSACTTSHTEQLNIMLYAKRDLLIARSSSDELSLGIRNACHLGHIEIVERLLQEKADVNAAAAESSGKTALQAAAGGGHLAVVERLLQEKADINAAAAKYHGRTALHGRTS